LGGLYKKERSWDLLTRQLFDLCLNLIDLSDSFGELVSVHFNAENGVVCALFGRLCAVNRWLRFTNDKFSNGNRFIELLLHHSGGFGLRLHINAPAQILQ
jgi:hypothetical protein